MVGVGVVLGLLGGVGRLIVERRRGGLPDKEEWPGAAWTRRQILVTVVVIALIIGAGFARTGDEPLAVYLALVVLAAVILLFDRVESSRRASRDGNDR